MADSTSLLPPHPPIEPEPWECCGSGCEPCVYDRYWQELARYEETLARWERDTRAPGDALHGGDPCGGPAVDKGKVTP